MSHRGEENFLVISSKDDSHAPVRAAPREFRVWKKILQGPIYINNLLHPKPAYQHHFGDPVTCNPIKAYLAS